MEKLAEALGPLAYERILTTVDTHTAGEPTRIVVAGVPFLRGKTMAEKCQELGEHHDSIRTLLMYEPRGHHDMFGAILTAPCSADAQVGAVYMDGDGYLPMCGHGTIGVITAILEMGLVVRTEPETKVMLDTPAGLVRARARVENGRVRQVAFENVPAFLVVSQFPLAVPDFGTVVVDISFGGNFFALVKAEQLGLEIRPDYLPDLVRAGMAIREAANQQITVQHPTQSHIHTIDLVELYQNHTGPDKGQRNAVIFGKGQVDRSPCGTGTCAKMAALYAKGELNLGEVYTSESILGTRFSGQLLNPTEIGSFSGVVPEIAGSAYVTGFQQFVVDPDDPLKNGFLLGS